jgi:hypothetical protein
MANIAESLKVYPLPVEDPQGGALNLTRFTGLGAALVAVLTAFDGIWNRLFGEHAPGWARPVVIVALLATYAVIAAADILSRGYTAGRRGDIIPMPKGLTATYKPGTDDRAQVTVTAVRFRRAEDDSSEFLIVKEDDSTAWAGRDELEFASGAAPSAHRRKGDDH